MAGRQTKLTPEVQATIIKAIRAGNYASVAAKAAGIDDSTYFRWLADPRPLYREFRAAQEKAEAEAEQRNVTLIEVAAATTWQAAAWMLERKHHQRWARLERQEHSGPGGGPIRTEGEFNVHGFISNPDASAAAHDLLGALAGDAGGVRLEAERGEMDPGAAPEVDQPEAP